MLSTTPWPPYAPGDVVPATAFTKLFTCAFILLGFGFGFVDVLPQGLVACVLDKQEAILLTAVDEVGSRISITLQAYVMNIEKGRMRIRMRFGLAVAVAAGCVAVGRWWCGWWRG